MKELVMVEEPPPRRVDEVQDAEEVARTRTAPDGVDPDELRRERRTSLLVGSAGSRISVDPGVMMGKPVIRGTRIPVELLLRKLGDGMSEAEILEGYPRLESEDLRAAQAFAAEVLRRLALPPVEATGTPGG